MTSIPVISGVQATAQQVQDSATTAHVLASWMMDPVRILKLLMGMTLMGIALLILLTPGGSLPEKAGNVGKLAKLSEVFA